MRGPGMTTEVEILTDLDSGALVLSLRPDHTEQQVRAAVAASADQHPGAVVLDLGPAARRWTKILRGLARTCARQAVPLLVVPVFAVPPAAPVRSLAAPLPLREHASVAEALASLPSALVPTAHRRRIHLPADPVSASRARGLAATTLRDWGLPELLFPVELIASELVSNAVRHAASPAELLLRLGPAGIRVAVQDGDPTTPTPPDGPVDVGRLGGRGLFLVASIAYRWGFLTGSHDKIVWADVRPAGSRGGLSSGRGRSARRDR